jgi:alkenylglycerophosphocholine hydrolase
MVAFGLELCLMAFEDNKIWYVVKYGLVLLVALLVCCMLFGIGIPNVNERMTASTIFVLLGVLGANFRNQYDWLIILALIHCWLGDYAASITFTAVASAFLVGHLFLIAAYFTKGIEWSKCMYMAGPVFIAFVSLLFWLHPQIPSEIFPLIISYMLIISLMVVFAAGASSKAVGKYLLIGSIFFFISDIFVARGQFVTHDIINRFGVYPLYYGACVLFALSLWARNKES